MVNGTADGERAPLERPVPAPATAGRQPPASRLPRGLSAFQHRNYRLFWFGQLVSVTGTWMQTLAQSWLVLSLTSSAFRLGLVNVFQFAPVLALGLVGGVLADRFPKRSLLVATQTTSALLAAALALLVWSGQVQLWQVYALALGLGIVNALDMPTRQAFVVDMVGKDDLMNAIALNSSLFNAARIVGPALAGLLLATVGMAACFGINAVSYLAVIAGLLLMRLEPGRRQPAGGDIARLREGLAYVRRTPGVYFPIILVGLVGTFGMNFAVWVPLLAKHDLDVGAGGFGILMSSLGVGALIGALGLAFVGRSPSRRYIVGTAMALGAMEVLLALAAAIPLPVAVAMVLLAGLGLAMTTTMAMANTRVQTTAPDELRGRVMSVYMTVFAGTGPFGALLAGVAATALGTPGSLALGGAVTVAAAIAVALMSRRVSAAAPLPAPRESDEIPAPRFGPRSSPTPR